MRKLVTIQEIIGLNEIPNADKIELARVMGWNAVVNKGEYHVGDKCVYFEVDSFLPISPEYEFLRKSSYVNNEYMGEGFRIKTMRLRGCLSQGLIMPITVKEGLSDLEVGTDVTELMGVKKWELPEIMSSGGIAIGKKPFGIPTTDELRLQSNAALGEALKGKPYYITTKMDGTSMTVYHKDGMVGVCGRNDEYKDTPNNAYWKCAYSYDLPKKLKDNGFNIAIQGELCGHGIQKNRLKLMTPKFFVFDIIDLNTNERLGYEDICKYVKILGLDMVPVEEVGASFNYTLDELLVIADGKYDSGLPKEGIVIRPLIPEYNMDVGSKLSFKVLNNKFLLKE